VRALNEWGAASRMDWEAGWPSGCGRWVVGLPLAGQRVADTSGRLLEASQSRELRSPRMRQPGLANGKEWPLCRPSEQPTAAVRRKLPTPHQHISSLGLSVARDGAVEGMIV